MLKLNLAYICLRNTALTVLNAVSTNNETYEKLASLCNALSKINPYNVESFEADELYQRQEIAYDISNGFFELTSDECLETTQRDLDECESLSADIGDYYQEWAERESRRELVSTAISYLFDDLAGRSMDEKQAIETYGAFLDPSNDDGTSGKIDDVMSLSNDEIDDLYSSLDRIADQAFPTKETVYLAANYLNWPVSFAN